MPRTKNRYIPALDGLRAFAVLAVIAYHMGLPFAQGGLLGVTVFFVLSGLPYYQPSARRMGQHEDHRPEELLASPRETVVPCYRAGHHRLHGAVRHLRP